MSPQSSKNDRGGQNVLPPAVKVFYSYADEDSNKLQQLEQQLSPLRDKKIIEEFHRGMLQPGEDEEQVVKARLKQAQIILLLISTEFLTKRYNSTEVQEIVTHYLKPDIAGLPRVIPILLRPTALQDEAWLIHLTPLPPNWVPATQWGKSSDDAFREIARRIRQVIDSLTRAETGQGSSKFSLPLPPRNPLFTGRKKDLTALHNKLQKHPTALTQPQAISGLGGVGKTQIAVHYVHTHRTFYRNVFWVNAETQTTLTEDYVKIAKGLGLPARNQQDQGLVVQAVMDWLETYSGWLLVLDNADDPQMVARFLPHDANGYILLTTRAANVGNIAEKLEILPMAVDEGVQLLLQQSTGLPSPRSGTNHEYAERIVRELGGLPLALDQARAYIEATGCGLEGYLQVFKQRRSFLLSMREPQTRELNTKELNTRGLSTRAPAHHPESVVTTFSLAFERVEKISKEAADVLRLCAFLAPDAIPETLIHIEQWKLNEACQVLLKFSLIRRDENTPTATTGTLTAKIPTVGIHRLVQAVLRDSMDEPTRRRWAFQAIKNVSTAFPTTIEVSAWPACQLLLPHVQICSRFIAVHKFRAPRLLTSAGWYLFQRAQYREAEPLYKQARSILEQMHTPNDLDLAQVQHRLGELYERLGWSALAEEELRQALDIRRRSLGSDAPEIAATLMSLARVYRNRSKYSQAEPLYTEAQSIYERALIDSNRKYGVRHPITDQCMDNLAKLYDEMATLYRKQKRYDDAGRLYDRALDISQQLFGKNHPFTAQIYHNQAELYKDQGDLQEAKRWHQEALKIRRQYFGDKNPETATSLHSLAGVYAQQGKREEAEQCYQDALDIRRKDLGAESSETAETMFGLAELYRNWGKEREAERYYLETLLIWETVPGQGSQSTFDCQRALANLYESQGRLREAERLYKKALSNRYEKLRPHDPTIQQNIECLAKLYERQNKEKDLAELYEEAFEKRARRLGIDHPATEQYWTLLIQFYRKQVNEQDVQHLYEKAFNMRVRSLRGDDRTSVERFAHTVQYLAGLYRKQGQESYLRSLYEQAAEICHERLGRLAPLTLGYLDALARISDQDIIPLPVGRTHGLTVPLRGTPPGGIVEPGKPADFQGDLKLKMAQQEEQKLKEELKKHYRERGVGDPATIQCRHELAKLYEKRNKLKEAEYVYKEALFRCSHDTKLGPEHPTTIECQNDLAKCYWSHRKYEEAKSIIRDALDSCELVLETTTLSQELTPIVAHSLDNAALYYKWRGLREKAESLLQRALALCEQVLGEEHSETVNIREHYTDLLEDETQRRLLL